MTENNDFNNIENDSTNSRNEKRFVQSRHWCIDRKEKRRTQYWDTAIDWLNELSDENKQLKQSIKEIDDAELHLKQIILKRIDDYIWEWEDEGTPVAQVLRELRDEIKGDVE